MRLSYLYHSSVQNASGFAVHFKNVVRIDNIMGPFVHDGILQLSGDVILLPALVIVASHKAPDVFDSVQL